MSIKQFLQNPIKMCDVYLALLSLMAIFSRIFLQQTNNNIIPNIILNAVIILGICMYTPYLLTTFNIKKFSLDNSFISGMILFLLIDPKQSIWITIIMCIMTLLTRVFIRFKNVPIVNPAAFGIAIVIAITSLFSDINTFVSWWGVSFAPRIFTTSVFTSGLISIAAILTITLGIYLAYRMNRLNIFLLAYFISIVLSCVLNIFIDKLDIIFIIYRFVEGTLLFALLIMLIEPKTSPIKKSDQTIYALSFASVWAILEFKINVNILYAILAANIVNFSIKYYRYKSHK